MSPWFRGLALGAWAVLACLGVAPVHASRALSAVPGDTPVTEPFSRPPKATHLSNSVLRQYFSPDEPQQVHINLGGPGEVFVVYATEAMDARSIVRYGASEAELSETAEGESSTYNMQWCPLQDFQDENFMPGSPDAWPSYDQILAMKSYSELTRKKEKLATTNPGGPHDVTKDFFGCMRYESPDSWYQSPAIHTVKLTNLEPGKTYYYSCGPESSPSKVFSFKMPPAVGPDAVLKLGVWADVGQSNVSLINGDAMLGMGSDLNLMAGDLSYADGVPPRQDTWGRLMEPVLANHAPHIYCPGNHEAASSEQFVHYSARFPNGHRASGSNTPMWFSVEAGPVHIISLVGNYAPVNAHSAQYRWLARDLSRVDRSRTPWVVAMWHAPWYQSSNDHVGETDAMQKAMEQLLVKAGVNIVINGHVHSYERSHPMVNGTRNECGPVYIVVGDGGNYEGPMGPTVGAHWVEPQPATSAFRTSSFGVASLQFDGGKEAHWRWVRQACVSKSSGMFDTWSHEATATYWVAIGNDANGKCKTSEDTSLQAEEPVDYAIIKPLPAHCSAK